MVGRQLRVRDTPGRAPWPDWHCSGASTVASGAYAASIRGRGACRRTGEHALSPESGLPRGKRDERLGLSARPDHARSRALLLFTALDIATVAPLAGYGDAAHFSRAFRTCHKATLRNWRLLHVQAWRNAS